MRILIRTSKYQKEKMNINQLKFANKCVISYACGLYKNEHTYQDGAFGCDVYRTKTQISAVVYFR